MVLQNKALKVVLMALLVLVFAISCGKDKSSETTPPATVAQSTTQSTPVVSAPVVETVVEEEPVSVVETIVEETGPEPIVLPESFLAEEDLSAAVTEENVSTAEPVETVSYAYPVHLSTTLNGETFSIEAYDGYAFVTYPETYSEEFVSEILTELVDTYASDYSDVIGWSIENPGEAIIAYPFGIPADQIVSICQALETMAINLYL